MIFSINRHEPLSVDDELYHCTDSSKYTHISNLIIADPTPHAAENCLLESIDTDNLKLMESDDEGYENFLPLDFRTGLAICKLPLEEQSAFWEALNPKIDDFCNRYIKPEVIKKDFIVVLPGTQFSHVKDASDELYAFIFRPDGKKTIIGFLSALNSGGPHGPDLMLAT